MTQADYAMFPPIFDRQELTPKLKLWALLISFPRGAMPEELALAARRWGIAVGDIAAITRRTAELLAELEATKNDRQVERGPDGRYRAVPMPGETIIGPQDLDR